MKKIKRTISLILMLSLSVSSIMGCSKKEDASSEKQSIAINIQNEPAELNSILTSDVASMNVLGACEEGLTRVDKENKIIPGLAEKWDVSDDKLEYTFHLRDAKWSDGSNITAKDFEFAWKTVLNPSSGSEYVSWLYSVEGGKNYNEGKGNVDSVNIKAVDEKTLKVKLTNPTPYFLYICSKPILYPVKQEFYEKQASDGKNVYGTDVDKLIYCGPWKMKEWSHNNEIVLEKNENYYNSKEIKLDEIKLKMIGDTSTAYNMFKSGDLDSTELSTADLITLGEQDGLDVKKYSGGSTTFMAFNLSNKIFSNPNIRKAFSYAIDREAFTKNVLKNGSKPAYSIVNPAISGVKGSFQESVVSELKNTDTASAKKYLEQGMKELGISELPTITFLIDDRDSIKLQSATYQEYWKKNLGVNVEVESMPFKAKLAKQNSGDFMITISGWESSYDDPTAFLDIFATGNANNSMGYSNAEYDKLYNEALIEADTAKRLELLKQAELLMLNDCGVAPLYYSYTAYVVQPKLKDFFRGTFTDMSFYGASVQEQ